MKSIFEKLQDYFNNTSDEQVAKDWSSTSGSDNISSPTIEGFIAHTSCFFELENNPPDLDHESFVNNIKNPNFTSDFFLTKTYGKSKLFNRAILF
jgi:hypothetical protein